MEPIEKQWLISIAIFLLLVIYPFARDWWAGRNEGNDEE